MVFGLLLSEGIFACSLKGQRSISMFRLSFPTTDGLLRDLKTTE